MCRVLKVSRSGYYDWLKRKPSQHALRDQELKEHIVKIHAESKRTYGAPRIHVELRESYHIHTSEKRVARLMRELGIHGEMRRSLSCDDPA